MSSRVFKVGVVFEFHPDTYHADMFEVGEGEPQLTEEQIVARCQDLAFEDISNLVYRGELWESMSVDIAYDLDAVKCSTCAAMAKPEEMTEINGIGSGGYVCENCWETN